MNQSRGPDQRFLMLGPPTGWHAGQLRAAAARQGHRLDMASWESLAASIDPTGDSNPIGTRVECAEGSVSQYDAILTRTMPAGSMEQITFRLAALHAVQDGLTEQPVAIVNEPRSLELSIDKFATLARLSKAGLNTPPTRVVQTRREAMDAFDQLGGDCVVKPIFGGEGRGVMRISDPQLAWYCFSSLEQVDSVLHVQTFISPGGSDTRLLVVGDHVFGVRRSNPNSFRSNVSAGAACKPMTVSDEMSATAKRITKLFGLVFASVDLIDNDSGPEMFLEVNAIPGWKGAQSVANESIADRVIETLANEHQKERG